MGALMWTNNGATGTSALAAFILGLLLAECLTLIIVAVWSAYFQTRLGLAPYAAASERLGPFKALGLSWRLTRGNFWRTFGVVLVIGLLVGLVSGIAGQLGLASVAIAYLVLVALVQVFASPLQALMYVTLLYDLRLRREGYAAVARQGTPAVQPAAPSAQAE